MVLKIYQQNTNGRRFVTADRLRLSDLQQGRLRIFTHPANTKSPDRLTGSLGSVPAYRLVRKTARLTVAVVGRRSLCELVPPYVSKVRFDKTELGALPLGFRIDAGRCRRCDDTAIGMIIERFFWLVRHSRVKLERIPSRCSGPVAETSVKYETFIASPKCSQHA